ncbi:UDP-3-O-(3-hydroxymyristoyl)glucosamine N-acyltransferase [bacterium]|nr:UDP-3-O-(3-hydroxymyristoyl)glucosamine N-acyltransferase [bacterium]
MISFSQIATEINLEIVGSDMPISNISDPDKALESEVVFVIQKKSLHQKRNIRSKAWIINKTLFNAELSQFLERSQISHIVSDDIYDAFAKVIRLFYPNIHPEPLIHPSAVIDKLADCEKTVHIGPHVNIGARSRIGSWVTIMANSFVGNNVQIGDNTVIYPNVTIYDNSLIGKNVIIHAGTVIGSDGFGYYKKNDRHQKIPHVGKVVIEDDVEVGSNCAIDRGTLSETRIMRGSKLDNLVQIAHNVVIGENTLIAAQSGIAGSTIIGDNVTIAGQVGIVGHITVGNNVTIGAQSGVISSIGDGETVSGYPARNHAESLRKEAYIRKIPDIVKKLKQKPDK